MFTFTYKLGKPWYQCGPKMAGNGALMRIAPMIIPHLKTQTGDLWIDTALSAMMTHNDSASISSCLAFVYMLRELIQMDEPPEPLWWPETFVKIAKDLECDETYQPRGGAYQDYQGPLWRFIEEKVVPTYEVGLSCLDACNLWHSGAYLLETVPSVIYILMKYGHDPEEAIIRAVNDTCDNDTIAAIVGAVVGALHGRRKLPERWFRGLLGRTDYMDDGRVRKLLDTANSRFCL
jgi:ADP-ribosylglycohydrolase